jgi:dCTP deaminase
MSVLSDKEIRKFAEKGMITPFKSSLINKENDIPILSYGLSSYGYDIRLSPNQCLLFGGVPHGMCDAKNFDPEILKETELHEDERGKYFIIPPFGYCLGVAMEHLCLPRDVTVVAVGKSTYARAGIMANITPAEAGWEGHLTLEIRNCTPLFNRIYANEGICQLLFYQGEPCDVDYKQRKGKYQSQPYEIVLSKV